MITSLNKTKAMENLNKFIGCSLRPLAEKFGVTVVGSSGKINKGWKGLTIEYLAGLSPDERSRPDHPDFELKSISYYKPSRLWEPRETMAVTMVVRNNVVINEFIHSSLYHKLSKLLICATSWEKENDLDSKLLKVVEFETNNNTVPLSDIINDYNLIRNKLRTQGFNSLTSADGKYIQTRTKGSADSESRAFYVKKNLLKIMLPPF